MVEVPDLGLSAGVLTSLAGMYCEANGRPSLPPSFMSGATLLQYYDDVSDEEAVDRLRCDLRWKVASNLPLGFSPPHPSSFSIYRRRLLEHGQELSGGDMSRMRRASMTLGLLAFGAGYYLAQRLG